MMYTVAVGFAGFIGVENEYNIEADSQEEAMQYALEEAVDDLSIKWVETGDEEEEE